MRFKTESGTSYELTDIKGLAEPALAAWSEGLLVRNGVPIRHFMSGDEMNELLAQRVLYERAPAVGEHFRFVTTTHGRVVSTPVVSIEEE